MLHTTRAVVLKTVRHGDGTMVLRAFTETLGVRSFWVRLGWRSGISQGALQPLSRLEVVAQEVPERDLLVVKELRLERPYTHVLFDPVRSALALFVQEVLYKVLRGESQDAELFALVDEALDSMDTAPDVSNFPLVFLVRFSEHLGFMPSPPRSGEDRFDLKEGEFLRGAARHGHTMGPELSTYLSELLPLGFERMHVARIPARHRRVLLDHLLLYFRLHVEGLGELRSPGVLHQVLG